MLGGELQQWRSTFSQALQIDDFVVGRARLPTLPDDPDPFEGQGAHGGVVRFAFGALHGVVGAGPERMLDARRIRQTIGERTWDRSSASGSSFVCRCAR